MKTFYWLVKREFWEHKGGFFWAPVVTGIVFLVLNTMGIILGEVFGRRSNWGGFKYNGDLHFQGSNISPEDLHNAGAGIDIMLYAIAGIVLAVTAIVVFFYCLGALYDDRRDRSVLFWKSLPLSDTSTVLSKVVSAILLAPAIAVVVGVIVGLALAILVAIVATMHGIGVWSLLMEAHPFRVVLNLVLLIPLYAIWALPTIGWLLLCSSWARGKPFLWAIALPVGAGVIVSWFGLMGMAGQPSGWFWKNVVGRLLGSLIPGGWVGNASPLVVPSHDDPAAVLEALDLSYHYSALASPSLWIGAAAGVAMIAGAIWFRRWRDDS
jgi:ABC-2 type transport system permease protein